MPLSTGQILNNRYRIVKLLGSGGFGAVYRAWDMNLKGACAVKENLDTSAAAQSQFAREASILFQLRHTNLPRVTDHFSLPDQGQYLVMDFIEGENLQEMLDRSGGPLPEDQVLVWIQQVLDALQYLHSRRPPVIHRDLKPANIRITPEGKAVLVDFGIAKFYDPALRTTLGARAVTPGFSPFEQYGQKPTDARTDLYAVGATLYALLTGHTPPESIDRVGGFALPAPHSLNPAISPHTETTLLKAMELMPDQRYQSAAEFRIALEVPPVLAQAPASAAVSVVPLAAAALETGASEQALPARRKRLVGTSLGVILLISALASGGILYSFFSDKGQPAPPSSTSTHTPFQTLAFPTATRLPAVQASPSQTQALPSPTRTLAATSTRTPTLTLASSTSTATKKPLLPTRTPTPRPKRPRPSATPYPPPAAYPQ